MLLIVVVVLLLLAMEEWSDNLNILYFGNPMVIYYTLMEGYVRKPMFRDSWDVRIGVTPD